MQSATYSDPNNKDDHESVSSLEYSLGNSIEQKYLEVMKRLQFGKLKKVEKIRIFYNNFSSQTLTR